ncbi:hypothetical protein TRAPUB_2368, partial [Trametes pubescens]
MPDKGDGLKLKIDVAFFPPERTYSDGRPHWADQVIAVEFKSHKTSLDPFDDRVDGKVDADAISRKKVRGQIIHYAEQIFRYQHRTALYMLLIIGRRFRFLRWDRSGTIVTRAADYFEQPDLLCKMLWRMSQLNEEQLGYDPSAIRIDRTDPDYLRMNTIALPVETDADHMERKLDDDMLDDAPVYRYVRDMFRRSLHPEWPRYRLEVKDTD